MKPFERSFSPSQRIGRRSGSRSSSAPEPATCQHRPAKNWSSSPTYAGRLVDIERRVAGRDVKPSGELRVTTNVTPRRTSDDADVRGVLQAVPRNHSRCRHREPCAQSVPPRCDVASAPLPSLRKHWWVAESQRSVGRSNAHKDMQAPPSSDPLEMADLCWIGFGDAIGSIGPAKWLGRYLPQRRSCNRLNTVLVMSQAVEAVSASVSFPASSGQEQSAQAISGNAMAFDAGLWLLTHPDLKKRGARACLHRY